jgi:hypothetical protein
MQETCKYKFSFCFFAKFFKNMVTSTNLGPTQGPILLGKNYELWYLRMRSFLQAQECWDRVDHGYVELDPANLSTMTNQHKIAQEMQRNKENKAKF